MATYTTKYSLKKPGLEDFGDIADINANMDIIDAELAKKADLDENNKISADQMPEITSTQSAEKLKTARTIGISGGATGTATSFDGSANITIPVTALDVSKAAAGTLPVARGGTGATTAASALSTLGALPKAGGTMTGNLVANNPAVGTKAVRNIYAGTTDMTAGTTDLTTGTLYLVYE